MAAPVHGVRTTGVGGGHHRRRAVPWRRGVCCLLLSRCAGFHHTQAEPNCPCPRTPPYPRMMAVVDAIKALPFVAGHIWECIVDYVKASDA